MKSENQKRANSHLPPSLIQSINNRAPHRSPSDFQQKHSSSNISFSSAKFHNKSLYLQPIPPILNKPKIHSGVILKPMSQNITKEPKKYFKMLRVKCKEKHNTELYNQHKREEADRKILKGPFVTKVELNNLLSTFDSPINEGYLGEGSRNTYFPNNQTLEKSMKTLHSCTSYQNSLINAIRNSTSTHSNYQRMEEPPQIAFEKSQENKSKDYLSSNIRSCLNKSRKLIGLSQLKKKSEREQKAFYQGNPEKILSMLKDEKLKYKNCRKRIGNPIPEILLSREGTPILFKKDSSPTLFIGDSQSPVEKLIINIDGSRSSTVALAKSVDLRRNKLNKSEITNIGHMVPNRDVGKYDQNNYKRRMRRTRKWVQSPVLLFTETESRRTYKRLLRDPSDHPPMRIDAFKNPLIASMLSRNRRGDLRSMSMTGNHHFRHYSNISKSRPKDLKDLLSVNACKSIHNIQNIEKPPPSRSRNNLYELLLDYNIGGVGVGPTSHPRGVSTHIDLGANSILQEANFHLGHQEGREHGLQCPIPAIPEQTDTNKPTTTNILEREYPAPTETDPRILGLYRPDTPLYCRSHTAKAHRRIINLPGAVNGNHWLFGKKYFLRDHQTFTPNAKASIASQT